MTNPDFQIPKFTDRDLINRMIKGASDAGARLENCDLHPHFGGQFNFSAPDVSSFPENAMATLELDSELLNHGTLNFHFPGVAPFGLHFQRAQDKPFDKVTVHLGNIPANKIDLKGKAVAAARKALNAVHSSERLKKSLELEEPAYAVREAELTKIEQIGINLVEDQAKRTKELEEQHASRQKDLEKRYQDKEAQLKSEQAALEQRKKEIDDRESKHARRANEKDLKKIFQGYATTFTLSKGTQDLRRPIKWFTFGLITFLGGLLVLLLGIEFKIFGDRQFDPTTLLVTRVAFGLALGGAALFYIRWQNRWFEQHSKEEFELKRMEIDLHRASWAVELAMEWKKETGEAIPDAIFTQLSRNLFSPNAEPLPALHPADQLASAILGSSAEVEIPLPNGGKVKLDRKGVKQLEAH